MTNELTECQARVDELTAFETAFRTLVPDNYVTAGGDSGIGGLVRGSKRLVSAPDNLTLDQGQFCDNGPIAFARYYGNTAEFWAPREAIIQELRDYLTERETNGQAITQAKAEKWLAGNSGCGGAPLYQVALGLEPTLKTKDEFTSSYLIPCREWLMRDLARAQARAERAARPAPARKFTRCSVCGEETEFPMLASLGVTCANCYDAASD